MTGVGKGSFNDNLVHHVLIIFIKPERALMIEHCAQRLRRKLGAIIKTAEDFPVLYCLPVAQLLECTGAQGFLLRALEQGVRWHTSG